MKRRVFLKATSTSTVAGLAVLAGCSSGSGSESGNGSEGTSGGSEPTSESGGETSAESQSTTEASGGGAATTATSGGSTTGTNGTAGATTGGGGGGGTTTVGMHTEGGSYYFDPIGLYVEPGATVTFEIESGAHSTTSYTTDNPSVSERRIPEGAESWDSGTLSSGSFEHTFETEGTYDYYCIPHKTLGMVGRVVVGSPGGPAEGSMPPDGDVPESQTIVDQGSVAYSDFS